MIENDGYKIVCHFFYTIPIVLYIYYFWSNQVQNLKVTLLDKQK